MASNRQPRAPARFSTTRLVPFGGALILVLITLVPPASAAAPVYPRYTMPCNPSTYGDPYVKSSIGKVAGGHWFENWTTGHLYLPGNQIARSANGGVSVFDLWPWFTFGPGTPGACVVKSSNTTTRLAFDYVAISWTVQLAVNCSGETAWANAGYGVNITGDMYDYSATPGTWLVSRWNHTHTLLGAGSIHCSGRGANSSGPTTFGVASATSTTGKATYTLLARESYFYFAQTRVIVSAETSGSATAVAIVSDATFKLAAAHCTGC